MSTQVKVAKLPLCDVCSQMGERVNAYADAKLSMGPWAYVCRPHFDQYGCRLGTGLGQMLVLT